MTDTGTCARELVARCLDLDVADIEADASIETLNAWDSLAHLRIVIAVEERIGRELEPEVIVELTGVSDVAAILEGATGTSLRGQTKGSSCLPND